MRKNSFYHREWIESENNFFVSWSDVLSLLLVMFVFIVSISEINPDKLSELRQSVSSSFAVAAQAPKDAGNASALQVLLNSVQDSLKGQEAVSVQNFSDSVKLNFGEAILFESGQASLHHYGKDVLRHLVNPLKNLSLEIEVSGHTDSLSISNKSFSSNWHLSGARAAEVINFLVNQGIAKQQFKLVAHSSNLPVAENSTLEGRQKNRRVSFVIRQKTENAMNLKSESTKETFLKGV